MLTPKQRDQFMDQAGAQFENASKQQEKRLGDYERLGKRYGLERGDIIISEVAQPESFDPNSLKGADLDAYNWANSNPDDPRAARILEKLGVQ